MLMHTLESRSMFSVVTDGLLPGELLPRAQTAYDAGGVHMTLATNGTLTIKGTAKSDKITIAPNRTGRLLSVTCNGQSIELNAKDVKRVRADLGAGDDKLDARTFTRSITVRGEAGNDRIHTGRGDDRLFGDAGEDWLRPGEGHDTVHGGLGKDRIKTNDLPQADMLFDVFYNDSDTVIADDDHGTRDDIDHDWMDTVKTDAADRTDNGAMTLLPRPWESPMRINPWQFVG